MEKELEFLYQINGIDFWQGWQRIIDLEKEDSEEGALEWELDFGDINKIIKTTVRAFALAAKNTCFDGTIRSSRDIYFSGLPGLSSESTIIIGFKEDNNGTTYIYSHVPLVWLDEFLVYPRE